VLSAPSRTILAARGTAGGKALDHWLRAKSGSWQSDERLMEEQEVFSGQPTDMQAIMTNDARGG